MLKPDPKQWQQDSLPEVEARRLADAAAFTRDQTVVMFRLREPFYLNLGHLKARRASLAAQLQVRSDLQDSYGQIRCTSV